MPTSDYLGTIGNTLRASFVVVVSVVGLVWLNQRSLDHYWALHFHRESPWGAISLPIWHQGSKLMAAAEAVKASVIAQFIQEEVEAKRPLPEPVLTLPHAASQPVLIPVANSPQDAQQLSRWLTTRRHASAATVAEGTHTFLYDSQGAAILQAGKKVLFIGDSMMEGVAPRVIRLLKDEYQLEGINLSKRSTGLAYPGFFNWPEAVAHALENNPRTGALAVFLGPNDPWDMPVGKGLPYLKFGSEEWQQEYRRRIRQILDLTALHHIPVIWIAPPTMRKAKLNRGMAVLETLYESEVSGFGGIVLRVNDLFGYQNGVYSDTAQINNRLITVRTSDGIHFSLAGAEIIAKAILEKIHFKPQGSDHGDDE